MSAAPSNRLLPRASGRHREAAIALYRALLSSIRTVPGLDTTQCQQLQNVVRNRFKENRHNSSDRWLRLRFVAGYQGLDVLDTANGGDAQSRSYLVQLLARTPEAAKRPPAPANAFPRDIRRRLAKKTDLTHDATDVQPSKKPSIFDRPLPLNQLSGRRHVPHLFSANKIPVLRIKKPMPPALSSYLAKRIKTRQKRLDTRDRLAAERIIASREDEWDAILGSVLGHGVGSSGESWQQAIEIADKHRLRLHEKEQTKNRVMVEKMQKIVDQETALYEREKEERKQAKWRRRFQNSSRTGEKKADL